jgi:hypothetical protein
MIWVVAWDWAEARVPKASSMVVGLQHLRPTRSYLLNCEYYGYWGYR